MYISPLGDLVRQHNVSYHMYADDTQLYLSFRSNDHESIEVAKSSIEHCVLVIKKWMASNFLKLNDDKTELLVVHPKHIETPSLRSIAVGDEVINPSECARNVGLLSIMPNRPVRDKRDYPRKMERHFPIKPRQPIRIALATFYP